MSYTKTTWENGVTPLNATNMNKIEDGIDELSNTKVDKVTGATNGDIITFGTSGAIADSGKKIETSLSTSSDSKVPTSKAVATHVTSAISTKANKVSSTTADHFVSFSDANGTLKDSGKSASDFSKVTATDSGGYLSTITIDGTSHTVPSGGGSGGLSPITPANNTTILYSATNISGTTTQGSKNLVTTLSQTPSDDNILTEKAVADTFAQNPASGSYVVADTDGDIQVRDVESTGVISTVNSDETGSFSIDPNVSDADFGGDHVSLSAWQTNMALKSFGITDSTNQGVLALVSATTDTRQGETISKKASRMIFNADGSIIIERSFAQGESDPQNPRFDINGFDVYVNGTQIGGNPCIREDTLISMADGSKKQVKDINRGDEILSYDPATKTKVTAVVIACYKTGEEHDFVNNIFTDGNYLCTWGFHGYYNAIKGYIQNIQDVDPNAIGLQKSYFLNEDLQNVLVYAKRPATSWSEKKARYNLVSSNNLYFANGILLGGYPVSKKTYVEKTGEEVPSDVYSVLNADCVDYDNYNSIYENRDFLEETKEARSNLNYANRVIGLDKKRLSNRDYKTIKYTEGSLSEEDFEVLIADKNTWREEINNYQAIAKECTQAIEEAKLRYRNGVTYRSLFEQCCTRDNEALQLFKNWLQPKGE